MYSLHDISLHIQITFNTIFSKSTIDISRLIWTTTCWEVLQHGQERVHGLETVYLPFASSFMILRITSQPAAVIWSRGHWPRERPVIWINAIVLCRNIYWKKMIYMSEVMPWKLYTWFLINVSQYFIWNHTNDVKHHLW